MLIRKHLALLGYKAKDKVTNYEGIIDSISFDLYGCVQASLRPPINDKGELPDGRWFDIVRLEPKGNGPVMEVPNFEYGGNAEGKQGPAEKLCRRDVIA